MSEVLYAATPHAVEELLRGGGEFVVPERILGDLTEAQSTAVPPGAPHSIAQIVTHVCWNIDSALAQVREREALQPAHLGDTFAPIEPGTWPAVVQRFLAGIEECKRVAAEEEDTPSPSRDDTNIAYDLAEVALHNAYHLGQIVLLRRMQGLWPPEGGDDNDF